MDRQARQADFGEGSWRYITFMERHDERRYRLRHIRAGEDLAKRAQNLAHEGRPDLSMAHPRRTEEVAMCAVLARDFRDVFSNSFCFGFRLWDGARRMDYLWPVPQKHVNARADRSRSAQGCTRITCRMSPLLKSPLHCPRSPNKLPSPQC